VVEPAPCDAATVGGRHQGQSRQAKNKVDADRGAKRIMVPMWWEVMVPMWENEPNLDKLRQLHALQSTDPTRALAGLRALAGRGSVMSMVYIAHAYKTGNGTKIDLTQAEEWHRRAVAAGIVRASYESGRGHLRRMAYRGALDAFRIGAKENYAPSMNILALMYLRGEGVPRDAAKARDLLEGAVAQGHVFSKRNLGKLLMSGRFGRKHMVRGFFLFVAALTDVLIVTPIDPHGVRLR
jgi:uncharacterized protein